MKPIFQTLAFLTVLLLAACTPAKKKTAAEPASLITEKGYEVERFITDSGKPVDITLIKHGSLALSYDGISIQVDPVCKHGKETDYAGDFPKADFILVTHEHGDHLDADAIDALTKDGTRLLMKHRSCEQHGRGEVVLN